MFKTTLLNNEILFETKPGLFSKGQVDAGSRLLLENIEINDADTILDLGCGYGAIGLAVAKLALRGQVFMVDVDIRAVKYSRINAELNHLRNTEIIASDGFEGLPLNLKFNLVLSNPPSHVANETIIEFIIGAHKNLMMGGKLYFVTEKRIKPFIKREFDRIFGNYQMVSQNAIYVVSMARKTDS